jgi:hypothetical protein
LDPHTIAMVISHDEGSILYSRVGADPRFHVLELELLHDGAKRIRDVSASYSAAHGAAGSREAAAVAR